MAFDIDLSSRIDAAAIDLYVVNETARSESDWQQYQDRLFSNLLARTGLIYEMREVSPTEIKLADTPPTARPEKTKTDGRISTEAASRAKQIRVTCISSPIKIRRAETSGEFDLRGAAFRDGCHLVQADGQEVAERWTEERLKELDVALAKDPDIICFGEFSYPPNWGVSDPGWTVDSIRVAESRRLDFENKVVERLKKAEAKRKKKDGAYPAMGERRPFVFLGSYHCLMTLYHVGVIYPWGATKGEHYCNVMREARGRNASPFPEKLRLSAPLFYRKRFPARRAGEDTRVPAGRDFDIFRFPFGRVAVAICSDMVDLNQFLSIARYNISGREKGIDILLVPSFNESPLFPSMCRELSYLAGLIVVVVNANHQDANFPETQIYADGREFSERSMRELEKLLTMPVKAGELDEEFVYHKKRTAMIRTYSLNGAAIGNLRHHVGTRWKKRMGFINKKL